jgi:hypothetical protein
VNALPACIPSSHRRSSARGTNTNTNPGKTTPDRSTGFTHPRLRQSIPNSSTSPPSSVPFRAKISLSHPQSRTRRHIRAHGTLFIGSPFHTPTCVDPEKEQWPCNIRFLRATNGAQRNDAKKATAKRPFFLPILSQLTLNATPRVPRH